MAEETVTPAESPAPPTESSLEAARMAKAFAETPSIRAELEAARGDAPAAEPAEGELKPGEVGPQLVDDEASLDRFLAENPDVAANFREAKTEEDALRNAALLRELKAGREFAAEQAQADAQAVYEEGLSAALVGDNEGVAGALNDLVVRHQTLQHPEIQDLIEAWAEVDPDALRVWTNQTADQLARLGAWQQVQVGEEAAARMTAFQADLAQQNDKMIQQFISDHPEAERYASEMSRLAGAAGLQDLFDPAATRVQLEALYAAAVENDPDAAVTRDPATGAIHVPTTRALSEADRILNAAGNLRRPRESLAAFKERAAAAGFDVDQAGQLRSRVSGDKLVAATATRSEPGQPRTRDEWAAAEGKRLAEAWGLPSVQDELHGGKRSAARARDMAAADSAARSRPAEKPKEDAYWSYLSGFQG